MMPSGVGPDGVALPNKILFAQNLPEATTGQMLGMLFQQYPGFIEVGCVGVGRVCLCVCGEGACVHVRRVGCPACTVMCVGHTALRAPATRVLLQLLAAVCCLALLSPDSVLLLLLLVVLSTPLVSFVCTHTRRCAWLTRAPASPSLSLTTT